MHPPFIFTDHRVGPSDVHSRPHVKRTRPEPLRLTPTAVGWPPVPLALPHQIDEFPSGHTLHRPVFLQVVPPARNGLRDVFGRFLIRIGQRMILNNRLG